MDITRIWLKKKKMNLFEIRGTEETKRMKLNGKAINWENDIEVEVAMWLRAKMIRTI